ncbi:unnamed protein product [Adineta ricciae]|nr:unnamed protein product [Adineta ricciae]
MNRCATFGVFGLWFNAYQIFLFGLVFPSLMIILSILILKNLKNIRGSVRPQEQADNTQHHQLLSRRDMNLLRLTIAEVISCFVLSFLYPINGLYGVIASNVPNKIPAITGGNSKSLALCPINVTQVYHSTLVPAVWPVSYHGTGQHNALDIAEEDYKLSKHKRFLHGKGIYSSPAPKVAQQYATSFDRKVIPKKETGVGTYRLTAADEDEDIEESEFIRPYGLCLFK